MSRKIGSALTLEEKTALTTNKGGGRITYRTSGLRRGGTMYVQINITPSGNVSSKGRHSRVAERARYDRERARMV